MLLKLQLTCSVVISRTDSKCYWLDLKRRLEGNIDFKWWDFTNFNGFKNIIQLHPNFHKNHYRCVCVFKSYDQLTARNLKCTASASYVCQTKGTNIIETGKRDVTTSALLLVSL